ncbi:hypothetical protein SLA2020_440050 [Shorea laevis]
MTKNDRKTKVFRIMRSKRAGDNGFDGVNSRGSSIFVEKDGGFGSIYRLTRPRTVFIQTILDYGSFRRSGLRENDEVVNKQKMINGRASSSNFETLKIRKE